MRSQKTAKIDQWSAEVGLTEEDPQCLTFSGGGGFVTATVCPEGGETKVNLLAQEWEYQAKEFLSSLP